MIVYSIVERESGATPAENYGQNVGAMGLDALDQYLHGTDATPISAFMHEDTATLEQALQVAQPGEKPALQRRLEAMRRRSEWHDPKDGLRTVRTLLDRLVHDERHEGVVGDLKKYEAVLQEAERAGDRFRLNVRTSG